MLKITSLPISSATQAHLDNQQNDINTQASYEAEVNRAAALWDTKEKSIAKQAAFEEVKNTLQKMASGQHYCCYCEHNEHGDIEHIYPKSVFPNRAFVWDNYIWACKECNTGYKLDKFEIFDPQNSNTNTNITPAHRNRIFIRPANEDAVLINPRVDDPMDFLYLDLTTGILTNIHQTQTRDYIRANYTLELLELNEREGIRKARENASKEYVSILKRYIKAKNATNFEELETAMEEIKPIIWETNFDFEEHKTKICLAIQKSIYTRTHFTVWKELQRQTRNFPSLQSLFQQVTEALNW